MRILTSAALLCLASSHGLCSEVVLHVAPNGNDAWAGAAEQPLATLAGARERSRMVRRQDPGARVTIRIHAGDYVLTETFTLSEEDSGTADAPVSYAADAGGARILGGVRIPTAAWRPVSDASVTARMPSGAAEHAACVDLDSLGFDGFDPIPPRGFPHPVRPAPIELFFDHKPMTLARYPNEGFVLTGKVIDAGTIARDGGAADRVPVFEFEGDRPARWTGAADPWLFGYWKWDWADESIAIRAIDPDARTVTLAAAHTYGVDQGKPYFAENLLEELDSPGEYYLDRAGGVLYFWPPAPIGTAECWVSTLAGPMLGLDKVSHLQIEGLALEYARGDAILIADGCGITVEACMFRNLGNRAVVIRGGTDHAIAGCDIERTGEGGVSISGGDRATLTPCSHRVTDCQIRDFSRRTTTYRPAVRIDGVGCRIDHNEMSDAPHSAVIFGGNDHVIEYNDIHHVLALTGDGGAVYCGRDWTIRGTIIRGNHFHDIAGIRKWENAVYVDDQASGITVSGNLFERCHWGMLMGGGRDNTIEGNVFVDCGLALHFDARGLGWAAFQFQTLRERLDAMPIHRAPWMDRFPRLATLLDDDPMTPKGNVISENLLVRSGRIDQDMAPQIKEHGLVERNWSLDAPPDIGHPGRRVLEALDRDAIGPQRNR